MRTTPKQYGPWKCAACGGDNLTGGIVAQISSTSATYGRCYDCAQSRVLVLRERLPEPTKLTEEFCSKPLPPEVQQVINENFWKLLL